MKHYLVAGLQRPSAPIMHNLRCPSYTWPCLWDWEGVAAAAAAAQRVHLADSQVLQQGQVHEPNLHFASVGGLYDDEVAHAAHELGSVAHHLLASHTGGTAWAMGGWPCKPYQMVVAVCRGLG